MRNPTLFADVVLPLAVGNTFTYRIPEAIADQCSIGKRVAVQFGKSRVYAAIIAAIHETPPEKYEAKYLLSVIDDQPVVQVWQLEYWKWMSEYYLCTPGEVMAAALPPALKLASETRILLNREAEIDPQQLNDKEYLLIEALEIQPELSISEIVSILGQKTVLPYVKSLFDKGYIIVSEDLTESYKPKKATFIRLNPFYQDKQHLEELFRLMNRAPKQQDLLLAFLQLNKTEAWVSKKALLEHFPSGSGVFTALVEKEVFELEEREVSRFKEYQELTMNTPLSVAQQTAYDSITTTFSEGKTALLHGVTSSGKTLIYIRLIEECLASGKQALYLLPEIALTTQIINRLRKYFGDKIAVYHSRFSENERTEIWKNVLSGKTRIVLGARSAIFLPFAQLGLIVVDEEHEQSYKQQDPAPRYHARDAALFLGHLQACPVLLGSATPSLESYFNALQGKYTLVPLKERFGGVQLPSIHIADVQSETKKKTMQTHFSSMLMGRLNETLEKGEQAVLFQNRRGYAPQLECELCAFTPHCVNCDVSLTYHKHIQKLKCHYCGYQESLIHTCPACGSTQLNIKGFGTEKVEDELQVLLPEVPIARMDLDTTRRKNSTEELLEDFEENKTKILIGTQMVAKGLDFDNLTLTGILNADTLLNYPDFRAHERSFQLMMQVSGRAGRRGKQGTVIIQTRKPDHPVIQLVVNANYEGFYEREIAERQQFHYPPYYRLIEITIKHRELLSLNEASKFLADSLRKPFREAVLGPEFPAISRIRNFYQKVILLKFPRNSSFNSIKQIVRQELQALHLHKSFKNCIVSVDVDPC